VSREVPADVDINSDKGLTELLADTEGTTPEELERGVAEAEVASPERATVVDE